MSTLIVRPDKIGDLILSLSVVEAIKEKYEEEKLYYIVSKYASSIISYHPKIEGYIEIDKNTSINWLKESIKTLDIKKAIILFPTFKISLAIKLAGVKDVIFPGFRWYQFMFSHVVYLRRSKCEKKEWQYNIDLAREIFKDIEYREPKLYLREEEIEIGKKILSNYKKPYIGIYPGGGKELRWKAENFFEIARYLEKKGYTPIVLLGPQEKDLYSTFEKWAVKKTLSIRELMATIYLLDLFITNNTGPMHIRGAFKKPMIQLFDPRRAVNPERWGYHYMGAYILKPKVDLCISECNKCKYANCMDFIKIEDVKELIERWERSLLKY